MFVSYHFTGWARIWQGPLSPKEGLRLVQAGQGLVPALLPQGTDLLHVPLCAVEARGALRGEEQHLPFPLQLEQPLPGLVVGLVPVGHDLAELGVLPVPQVDQGLELLRLAAVRPLFGEHHQEPVAALCESPLIGDGVGGAAV